MLRRLLHASASLVLAAAAVTALAAPAAAVPNGCPDRLHAGESTPGNCLQSASGEFLLIIGSGQVSWIQVTKAAVLQAPLWTSDSPNRNDPTNRLTMQTDGNLVLTGPKGNVEWSSHTSGTGSNNTLVAQNDGDLVMYNGAGQAVWATHTYPSILDLGHVLLPGHLLSYTPPGYTSRTRLIMQANGDLVLYWGGRAVWTSHTNVPGSRLELLYNGNLVVYTPTNRAVWQSGTAGLKSSGLIITVNFRTTSAGVSYPLDRGYMQLCDLVGNTRWSRPTG